MKNIVFLYAGFSKTHAFDKVFSSQSAFERCLSWAQGIKECQKIVIAVNDSNSSLVKKALGDFGIKDYQLVQKESWTAAQLVESMALSCHSLDARCVVYAMADCALLDSALTEELLGAHGEYMAEYTFQDGYPRGFAPEIIDGGALNIISSLASGSQKVEGQKDVCADSIFNLMKGDINSFDIETVMAPRDFRLLRLDFSASTRLNLMASKKLYDLALENHVPFGALELTELAEKSAEIQSSVPAFYNVQLTQAASSWGGWSPYASAFEKKTGRLPEEKSSVSNTMSLEKFKALVSQISEFSETAVVGLSLWGECLLVEDLALYAEAVFEHPGLSLLIETDGLYVDSQKALALSSALKKYGRKNEDIIWIVSVDAFSSQMYDSLHKTCSSFQSSGKNGFETVCNAVSLLAGIFPGSVYPQFVRMNANESELEQFYRFWHREDSPSGGQLVIQKYDSFCGILPDQKPADLSPLKRNVCWHLKRDFCILWDGAVVECRDRLLEDDGMNVFNQGIRSIWEKRMNVVQSQIDGKLDERCRKCDEYYTFNF